MNPKYNLQSLARALLPFLKPLLQETSGATVAAGTPSPHGLNSTHHSGTLANSQAPQFLLTNGTRPLTGNLTVSAGVTIDGVDLSVHAADPNAHHNAVTVAGGLILAGQQLTVGVGNGTALSGTSVIVDLATNSGLTFSGGDLTLGTPGTATVSSSNAVSTSTHTHAVTSSSNPGAAASLLASDANGRLQLQRVGLGVAPTVPIQARATTEQLRLDYDVSNYASFTVGSGGNLTIAPTGDFIFDPTGNDVLPSTNYDLNLGALNKKYLTLHAAELWVETLVAQDTIATIGGRILVGPTTTLTRDAGSGTVDLYLKHNQMQKSDVGYMEASGKVEFVQSVGIALVQASIVNSQFDISGNRVSDFVVGLNIQIGGGANEGTYQVTAVTYNGGTSRTELDVTPAPASTNIAGSSVVYAQQAAAEFLYFTVTRNLDGSGANDWYAGDALFNTGTTGDGFIDIYSVRGVAAGSSAGPTIVGNVRDSSTYNAWTEHWAIGNLNGLYGYGVDTYGVGLGRYGDDWLTVDTTNGIRMYGSNEQKIGVQADGDVFIGTNVASAGSTYFSLFSNAQTYNGESMGAGDMLIGDNSASKANLLWDESEGRLKFRGGTTNGVIIDTDGSLYLIQGSNNVNKIRWEDGSGNETGEILGIEAGASATLQHWVVGGSSSNSHTFLIGSNDYANLHLTDSTISGFSMRWTIDDHLGSGGPVLFRRLASIGPSVYEDLFTFTTGGTLFVKDSANANMTVGLTINQGANDDEIIALKSSDVAHGITTFAETDTFGTLRKHSAGEGGVRMWGFSEGAIATALYGMATTEDTGKSTTANANVIVRASLKSGTTEAAHGANANLFAVRSAGNNRFIVDQEGDIHMDATSNINAWDEHNDIALLAGVREAMNPGLRLAEFVETARPVLERTGVVTYNPDGHHFISLKKLHALEIDAMRQLHQRIESLERQLEALR